jgi:hypothetical protein
MLTIREALDSGEIPANQYAYPDNRQYAVYLVATGERLGIVVRMYKAEGEFWVDTFANSFQVSGHNPEFEIRENR